MSKWMCVCVVLACSLSYAQTDFLDEQFEVNRTNDILYGTGAVQAPAPGEIDLLLDLYEPTGAGVPPLKPGFVIIHGRGSDKGSGKFVSWARDYAKRGYVCVSINYRIEEDDPPTPGDDQRERNVNAAVEDAVKAIAWLKANAAPLGIDPTRIAVGGNSFGGVTSLFTGFLELGPTAEVQVVVSYAAAMSDENNEGRESEIDAGDPPLILIYGDRDNLVPFSRSEDVGTAAAAAGIPYELHLMEGVGHTGVYNERKSFILPDGDTPFEKIEAFLYTQLELATIGSPDANTISINAAPGPIEEGDFITLTAPNGSDYQWVKDGEILLEAPPRVTGANDQTLVFDRVQVADSGIYRVDYDDGTKAVVSSEPLVLNVQPAAELPATGLLGISLLAALVAAGGVLRRH